MSDETPELLKAEIATLKRELEVARKRSHGKLIEIQCAACGRTTSKIAKYVRENAKKGRVNTCSKVCSAKFGGRRSGDARRADERKRHHDGGRKSGIEIAQRLAERVSRGAPEGMSEQETFLWLARETLKAARALAALQDRKPPSSPLAASPLLKTSPST